MLLRDFFWRAPSAVRCSHHRLKLSERWGPNRWQPLCQFSKGRDIQRASVSQKLSPLSAEHLKTVPRKTRYVQTSIVGVRESGVRDRAVTIGEAIDNAVSNCSTRWITMQPSRTTHRPSTKGARSVPVPIRQSSNRQVASTEPPDLATRASIATGTSKRDTQTHRGCRRIALIASCTWRRLAVSG